MSITNGQLRLQLEKVKNLEWNHREFYLVRAAADQKFHGKWNGIVISFFSSTARSFKCIPVQSW